MSRRDRAAARDAAEADRNAEGVWGIDYVQEERVDSPERLAWEAAQNGDGWFQIDIPLAYTQGSARMGLTSTRTRRLPHGDVISRIEAQGWQLEHVAVTFVLRGHASTKRMQLVVATSADDVAEHGELVGLYVFRRTEVGT